MGTEVDVDNRNLKPIIPYSLNQRRRRLLSRTFSRTFIFLGIFLTTWLLVLNNSQFIVIGQTPSTVTHPLPPTLARWQDAKNSGDYFDSVKPTEVGYLVWSDFPIKVYIETPKNLNNNQAITWVKAVSSTVQEWSAYLPLQIVEASELADITIFRKAPPLQGNPPRARSAQTTYNLYTKNNILYHRFNILLSPSQMGEYLIAAARHELGHALGIWGHSQLQSDALYFSQVRNPPLISTRDVNTLKRVYKQPTKLGWKQ
jgi:predicted Zn-dependent protease